MKLSSCLNAPFAIEYCQKRDIFHPFVEFGYRSGEPGTRIRWTEKVARQLMIVMANGSLAMDHA
jgi:hypothetical protein